MADWDADNFEPEVNATVEKAVVQDKWEGEDEEDEIKDNWDDEEVEKKVEAKKPVSEKKKLSEKIKEKENRLRKKQEQQQLQKDEELSPEEQAAEKLRVQKLQEEADLELAQEAFGISAAAAADPAAPAPTSTANNVAGIDAMCPSSKNDFTEFEKLLKEKIGQFEKSVYYSDFLDSLFRELCISLEVEDLKKVSTSLSVLLIEKQKQEKQNKGKKKKAAKVLAGGGLKAKMRDDMDYAEFDGGYTQDYEDFM